MSDEQLIIETPPQEEIPQSFWQKHSRAFWIALIAAAVATAGLLTYLLFFRSEPPEPEILGDAKLTIQAPGESVSGSEISYQIKIENLSNTALTNLVLEVFYPAGFSFVDSTPDSEGRSFKFDDLEEGGQHEAVIVGKLSGDIQEIKTVTAKLRYVPANFRSTFVASAQAATVMLPPHLELSVRAPTEIITGQRANYEIRVKNIAERDFSDIKLVVNYPAKLETGSPKEFSIDKLAAGEEKTIPISGKLFEEPGRESLISGELFLKDEKGALTLAGRSFAFTRIIASPLLIEQKLVKQTDAAQTGDILEYEISFQNNSQIGLAEVQILGAIEKMPLEFLKIETEAGQIQGPRIVFLPATNPELLVVTPNESGKFKFRIEILDSLRTSSQINPAVFTSLEFTSRGISEPISSKSLEVKVQTELAVSSNVSRQGSVYQIELQVSNSVNDAEAIRFEAVIPHAGAAASGPDVEFNPASGRLSWQIGMMSAHTTKKTSFNLVLQGDPASGALLKDIQLTARDKFTGKEIAISLPEIED